MLAISGATDNMTGKGFAGSLQIRQQDKQGDGLGHFILLTYSEWVTGLELGNRILFVLVLDIMSFYSVMF